MKSSNTINAAECEQYLFEAGKRGENRFWMISGMKFFAFILALMPFLPASLSAQCTGFAVIAGEWSNASLQKFDGTSGTYVSQIAAGIGTRINSVLQYPANTGNLYLGGAGDATVVDAFTGAVQFSFSGGPFSGLTEQIVAGQDGAMYVAIEGNGAGDGAIARYNATTGVYINTFIAFPSYQPNGLAQDAAGNWYVGTRNAPNTILKYSSAGTLLGTVTTMTGGGNPGGGLAVYNNELYVVTTNSPQTVEVYTLPITSFPATPARTIATGGSAYVGIAFGPDNNMYTADFFNGRITAWNPTTGALIRTLTNGTIPNPHGVAFTPCAPVSCALTSAGETLETCNNNGTTASGADDYITFSLNPTGTGLGANYSVTASGGATVTLAAGGAATGIAYGSATAFRLQNGSANGTSFTITVTDASGAACTTTTTVQQSSCSTPCPAPIVLCPGESYTLTADAGWSNYQWFYDADGSGPGAAVVVGNAAVYATANAIGIYTWTAEDGAGCPVVACCPTEFISGTCCTAPTLTNVPTNVSCNAGTNGAIVLTVTGGTGSSFTYDWSNDGPEAVDNDTKDLSGLAAGAYTVTVTSNDGCTATTSVTLTEPAAIVLNAVPTAATSCVPANGSIVLTVVGGVPVLTYDWSNDGPDAVDNDTKDLTGLLPDTYTVTVTDGNGCTATTSAIVTGPAGPSLMATPTPAACPGSASGSIALTVTGVAPFTYDWSNDGPEAVDNDLEDLSSLAANTYTVTVTDGGGCISTASAMITENPNPINLNVVPTASSSCIPSNGSIALTVTGAAPTVTYDWSNDGPDAVDDDLEDLSGLSPDTYTVTVTDGNGCTATTSTVVTGPAGPSLMATPTPAACPGSASGSIALTVTGTGPFTYDWSNDGAEAVDNDPEDLSGLVANTYTVTVTDGGGCISTTSATITENVNPIVLNAVPTGATTCVPSNGSIALTVTGAAPVVTYDWSNDGPDVVDNDLEDLTGLSPNTYTVTVTDGNLCTATTSAVVTGPAGPSVAINSSINILCFGEATGSINITASAGTPGYTYDWSNDGPEAVDNDLEDLASVVAGAYTVTVTDAGLCTVSTSTILTQPAAALTASLTGVTTVDCVNGTIDITIAGGTSGYTYDWDNDGAEAVDNDLQDLVVAMPGTYTVTVTDANGCTTSLSATYGGCDKGDLPAPYSTLNANTGASHVIITGLKIGNIVDAEVDGQPTAPADGDAADEDGFVPTAPANMLVAGRTTNIAIPLMNMTGGDAKLTVYFDWNKDGDIADANEMYSVSVPTAATTATLVVAVPADAVLNMDLGTRFRLTTSTTMSSTGFAPDGEVEDYLVQVMGFDYGDLSDSGAGTGTGNYNTQVSDNGASHKILSTIKLGGSVDAEADGQQSTLADGDDSTTAPGTDDENGVTLPMFVTGTASNVDFTLMNMTGSDAKLTLFIDWNKDGDFLDAGEMYSTTVANLATTASISVTPPLTAVLNMNLGVRVRLSTDAVASMLPTGPAPDGEVEDYVTQVMGFDYGDLADGGAGTATAPTGTPANHETLLSDNGPRHKIVTDPITGAVTLKIGASVDDDVNGAPSVDAGETGGDDNTESPDDEELNAYLDAQLFIVTQTTNLTIPVMNMTGSDAKLVVYFDFNKDGDFTDAGEMFSTTVANNATTASIAVVVPALAVVGQDLGFRVRLAGITEPMVPNGPANSGEVEDYMVQVIGYDYGDLPDTYNTNGGDNPPNHIVSADLKLGASVDAELDGAPEAMAGLMTGGDDADPGLVTFGTSTPAGDDENGVTFLTPMVPGSTACISVTAMNMNATAAVLQMWVDFNGDGDMLDAGEAVTTGGFNGAGGGAVVPATVGLTNAQLCFNVPATAVFAPGGAAFVRFRLSPLGGLCQIHRHNQYHLVKSKTIKYNWVKWVTWYLKTTTSTEHRMQANLVSMEQQSP